MTGTAQDRITEVEIENVRSIGRLRLALDGLVVLIGPNAAGKSTVLECLEILAKAGQHLDFMSEGVSRHGPLDSLLRSGETTMRFGATIEGGDSTLTYSFALTRMAREQYVISSERLVAVTGPLQGRVLLERTQSACATLNPLTGEMVPVAFQPTALLIGQLPWAASSEMDRTRRALKGIRVHVPFDVTPIWIANEERRQPELREAAQIGKALELNRRGGNLANCFHALKADPAFQWPRILDRVRLGLGADVVDLMTPAAGRGLIELVVSFRGLRDPVPAACLSDGQLTYLAFVALVEMSPGGLLAIDEPELHLHPELVVRVVGLLEDLALRQPILVATQSDRVLDALADPQRSVMLCDLDEKRRMQVLRPDAERLQEWLAEFSGLGRIRENDYLPLVMKRDAAATS